MLKATVLLEKDHADVMDRFDDFEAAEGAERKKIFADVRQALELHARLEEELFYPELRTIPELEDRVAEALQEHRLVKQMLGELGKLDHFGKDDLAKVKVLRENVAHHVEEEEGELFEAARRHWGEDQDRTLGKRIEERKRQLHGRPADARSKAPA
jgi:hypothetical protein